MTPLDPVVVLDEDRISVNPGEHVSVNFKLRNPGEHVEEYAITVLGEAAGWAEVLPPKISVYPDFGSIDVTVIFRPPLDTAIATGEVPFGIRVQSEEFSERASVTEGVIAVGSIDMLSVRIKPPSNSGRMRAKYRVIVHNSGTETASVRLGVNDPGEALSFALNTKVLAIPKGETREALLKVRPRNSAMLGQPMSHPFQVSYRRRSEGVLKQSFAVTTGGESESFADANFTQKPVLSAQLLPLLAMLFIAAGVGYALFGGGDDGSDDELKNPDPPQNFELTQLGPTSLEARWDPPAGEVAGYELIRLSVEDFEQGEQVGTEDPIAIDAKRGLFVIGEEEPLESGTPYCFRIDALNSEGESSASTSVRCETTGSDQDRSLPMVVVAGEPDRTEEGVTWFFELDDPASDADSTWFVVLDNEVTGQELASVGEFRVPVDPDVSHTLRVRAVDGDGDEATSATVELPAVPLLDPSEDDGGGAATATTAPPPSGGAPVENPRGAFAVLFAQRANIAVAVDEDKIVTTIASVGTVVRERFGKQGRAGIQRQDPQVVGLSRFELPLDIEAGTYILVVEDFADLDEATAFCTTWTSTFTDVSPGESTPDGTDEISAEEAELRATISKATFCHAFPALP